MRFERIHRHFGARVDGIALTKLEDPADLQCIRNAMAQYAVLLFPGQPMSGEEQLRFAERLDGRLHSMTTLTALADSRSRSSALTDISNLGTQGELLAANDRRRMSALGNRLWHTDASFIDPPGRYSMLSAKVVPPIDANTEFADTRAAYDALADETKAEIANLKVHHSIVYSRGLLGFEFTREEEARFPGAEHPLVRSIPRSDRKALYLASHASHVVGMPVAEGRLLLKDLTEHATQRAFVYEHRWRKDDFVIWDNRATMHRGLAFDDTKYPRELRRTTTLDVFD